VRDFLDFIQPEGTGYTEVRAIRDGRVRQWWTQDRQEAVDLALRQSDEGWDAYYGVIPRIGEHGDSDSVLNVTRVLWADLDAKMHGTKMQTLSAITRYSITPSVVVDSGHGYHTYWALDEWVPWVDAQAAMKGLAKALNGDHVYDQARILRIPGTMNWKEPDDPRPVRTIVFDTTNVRRFSTFAAEFQSGRVNEQPRESITVKYVPPADRDDLPDWLVGIIRDGAPQGQRSEQCFKVMCHLARRGWSDTEIKTVFEQGGIGEKMRERRDGDRWFQRSMNRARAQL
jgi:putative DNA primase/helicase